MSKKILVTGGAGFIGSHTCLELLNRNDEVVVVDNLSNSCSTSLERVQSFTGKDLIFKKVDLLDLNNLREVFKQYRFSSVIHFAGLKAVGESNDLPLHYYQNNLTSTLNLLEVMTEFDVKDLVFSSSATVYGNDNVSPLHESMPTSAINPYGKTKWFIEMILKDFHFANPTWNIAILRYFNPIGAHESGLIGEDPNGIPNNLLPYISQTAVGKHKKINVFGNDYSTKDGTGIRDYIHVVDLAMGHLKALDYLSSKKPGLEIFNLGTGQGSSVLEVIEAFEKASGKKIPYEILPRRQGDVAISYANSQLAEQKLNWKAERDLFCMCKDTWKWQQGNPNGFTSSNT